MILLFVGAGCSRAIDEEKFPTMVEFYEKCLPDSAKTSSFYALIVKYMQMDREIPVDIERILREVESAIDHFSDINNRDKVVGHLWRSFFNDLHTNNEFRRIPGFVNELQSLRDIICKTINSVYCPSDFRIPKYLTEFFKNLMSLSPPLEIFTTNYDLVIDRAISGDKETLTKSLERGRTLDDNGDYVILDTKHWVIPPVRLGQKGLFTKLHGSVDWKWKDGVIQCCSVQDEGFDSNNHPVLYPGFKGRPHEHPFDKFYDYLNHIARNTDIVIFVGFSFRDEEIEYILLSQLKHGTKIIVIDKEDWPTDTPQAIRDNATLIKSGFSSAATRECIGLLRE